MAKKQLLDLSHKVVATSEIFVGLQVKAKPNQLWYSVGAHVFEYVIEKILKFRYVYIIYLCYILIDKHFFLSWHNVRKVFLLKYCSLIKFQEPLEYTWILSLKYVELLDYINS